MYKHNFRQFVDIKSQWTN